MTYDEDTEYQLRAAAYEAVAYGEAEITGQQNGQPIFGLTEKGRDRARAIIDAAIKTHGPDAGGALAEALDVELEIGEELVKFRKKELAAQN